MDADNLKEYDMTLAMMDAAMDNYSKGIVSKPVDLKKMEALADTLSD
jgi:hypothetical protein